MMDEAGVGSLAEGVELTKGFDSTNNPFASIAFGLCAFGSHSPAQTNTELSEGLLLLFYSFCSSASSQKPIFLGFAALSFHSSFP